MRRPANTGLLTVASPLADLTILSILILPVNLFVSYSVAFSVGGMVPRFCCLENAISCSCRPALQTEVHSNGHHKFVECSSFRLFVFVSPIAFAKMPK